MIASKITVATAAAIDVDVDDDDTCDKISSDLFGSVP